MRRERIAGGADTGRAANSMGKGECDMAKTDGRDFFEITPEMMQYAALCQEHSEIDSSLYAKYDVKRGLRDLNGKGVLTGLTEISEIQSSKVVDGKTVPCEGKLFYRGYDVEELVAGFIRDRRFGFEEVVYLLLFGELPTEKELADFRVVLNTYRTLPTNFVRDIIMTHVLNVLPAPEIA